MKTKSDILKEILSLVKTELNEIGPENGIGYTMPDGNYHIFIYVDNADEEIYVIEPNKVVDGACEPIGENYLATYNDFAELIIGCEWCMEQFERDIGRENEISLLEVNTHLPRVANTRDYEILRKHLTVDSLQLIDDILKAAGNGRIDLQIPRELDGNIDFANIGFIVKDISYEETGFEKLVLKWYDDFENTDYLIGVFEEKQESFKTYTVTVDYLEGKAERSLEFSCVRAEKPGTQWVADKIFENMAPKYIGQKYFDAINSIYCMNLQVEHNGEYVDHDELCGEELLDLLDRVKLPGHNKTASVDEQIKAAAALSSVVVTNTIGKSETVRE